MKMTMMRNLAALAIALGAVLATPVAAQASYTPGADTVGVVSGPVVPGGNFTIEFGDGLFTPSAALTVEYSSTGPVPSSATFTASRSERLQAGNATHSGGARVTGTVPKSAVGSINATVSDGSNVGTAILTVITAGGSVTNDASMDSGSSAGAGPEALAHTGTYLTVAIIWGAIGLAVLGAGFLAACSLQRSPQVSRK
ncbi:hypothetical protein ACFOYW_18575 [Gryllotalpicola reticulitermitis]|uniref:Sortase n=1 Tax=Gryllotalpicola reticulitermitis TaxID=1184153 RepID=A0ABV8QD70_9MICO